MDFIKYFQDFDYIENKKDCWTFVRQVFKDEHNITLPDAPIANKSDIATYLIDNIKIEKQKEAKKGCIVYYTHENIHHAGYALDKKEFIHKTKNGVFVSKIPKNAIIYKVLNDKNH